MTPRKANFRCLFIPDPGHCWWKLDLEGADLWTVACRCAQHGDRTMLLDLQAGIRIPSLVGLALEHAYQPGSDRSKIKADCQAYRAQLKATGQGWKDNVWKAGSHLTNYGGREGKIREKVVKDSYKETGTPIDPGKELCVRVQAWYLRRYWGLPKWWSSVAGAIVRTGKLTMATGQVREFLAARPRAGKLDGETHREALAAEPQSVTAWIISQGLHRLWHDPANWPCGIVGQGDPIVQPLIPHVHDECTGQTALHHKEQARVWLKQWFSNPITIGHETITIPFAGGFGVSWGECYEAL